MSFHYTLLPDIRFCSKAQSGFQKSLALKALENSSLHLLPAAGTAFMLVLPSTSLGLLTVPAFMPTFISFVPSFVPAITQLHCSCTFLLWQPKCLLLAFTSESLLKVAVVSCEAMGTLFRLTNRAIHMCYFLLLLSFLTFTLQTNSTV